MKGIELDILCHTEATSKLEDLGINTSDEECVTKKFMFYAINIIAPRKPPLKGCIIYSSNESMISLESYETLIKKIDNW